MADDRRQFSMDVKVGQTISIDKGRVLATVMEKSGKKARLAFNAAKEVSINKVERNPAAHYAKQGLNA